jgi:hypothetical protein
MGNLNSVLTAIGFVATCLSLAIAVVQTVRHSELRKSLEKIRRAKEAEIWTCIGIVLKTYDSLEQAVQILKTREQVDFEALVKIQSARRGIVDQYRMLLKEAVLEEEEFSIDTIEKWKRVGRLENDWRVSQAKRLLATKNIPDQYDSSIEESR